MATTTRQHSLSLSDARRLLGNLEQQLFSADPTDAKLLADLKAKLRAADPHADKKRVLVLNDDIELRYEELLQELSNTLMAMGRMGPISPARSDRSDSNRGGVLDTAAGGPLKAMASAGDLRKVVDSVVPIRKADGSIDEAATAMKMNLAAGGLPGRLSPDGKRLK